MPGPGDTLKRRGCRTMGWRRRPGGGRMTGVARLRTWCTPAVAALALGLAGCGDGDDAAGTTPASAPAATTAAPPAPTAPEPPAPEPPPRPLPGLPPDTAGFEDWPRLNAAPIPPDSAQTARVGFDAHRGVKNVHVDQPGARAGDPGPPYPDGTVLVKAAGTGGDLTLVAIMRKVVGSDPAHGDWEYVEYKRSGAGGDFATDASLTGATCWSCHAIAAGTDWVFTPADPG